MAFPNTFNKQLAVYWGNPQNDGRGGYTYDPPIEIKCRWVDITQVIYNSDGNEITSTAEVQVEVDVVLNGCLLLSRLVDVDADVLNNPVLAGGQLIQRFDKIPMFKVGQYFRKAYL